MRLNRLPGEDYVFDRASMLAYFSKDQDEPVSNRQRMREILLKAITCELTQPQRICLTEYYLNGRKMKDIAQEMSLNPSTVTRHIKRAKEKLQHIAFYYRR